ncbi:gag/pol protein [Cucumis melo var. makuwa]|uniref:Gag/pol protein n=1 Tax=Cucumis melo var. makuwa TaxID=1194695 RepID=A0A5A7SNG8_CUCMM|nr:gag/pol protein [Cucumis melo var. makuwa]
MILVIAELRFVLMEECPPFPSQNASQSVKDAYDRWTKANDKARLYMMSSMSDILNKKHEIMVTARQIMDSLREMFGQPSIQIKQEAIKYVYYSFLQFRCNVEMNKIEYNMTTFLKELQNFQSLKGQKEGKANVTHSRRFAPSSYGSKKIQKRKGGKGKGSTVAAESKWKAKVAIKEKCFHCNVDGHSKRNCPKYLTKKKEKEGKMTKRPFTEKGYRAKEPLEHIHSGLCGPMNVKARGDFEYFISFIDDYSRYGYLYLMEHKSEALEKFKEYKAGVENLLKRRNRTLLDMVRSMMSYTQLPSSFWGGRKLSLSHFRIWSCPAHVLVKNPKKLEPHSRLCQFVGYPKETRGGLFFDSQENRVFVSTNTTFLEEDHMKDQKLRSKLVLNGAIDGSTRVVDEVGPLSRAMNDVDKDQWVKAMDLEMESMYFNSMWELVDLPEGVKPIGYKWIYKGKRDSAGKSIRILLSIATFYDYEIWKMDVNTAFLHGNLEESIFMSQLEGFITQGQEQKVCKLNRSIYGLKQASRSWNIRFNIVIESYGFDQNVDKPCVYKKINKRHGVHLSKEQCPKTPQEVEDMRRIPYASAVGSLMYVMLYTRAYICYAGEIVSSVHPELGSLWRSIKQGCIADSTMEAEYVAACEAAKEAV